VIQVVLINKWIYLGKKYGFERIQRVCFWHRLVNGN